MSKQQHDNKANKAKQKNLKKLLCKAIRFGTAQDVQRFRLFRDKIGSNNTNIKKKNPNPADEPLFVVMEKEDAKLYHEVFKFDLDLDCRVGPYDMTALHYAVETGKILAVAMLLYYGLDREALTSENEVPIQLAKSRNMRSVFNDFKQMSRSNFTKKYKLKIPKQTPNSRPFPFHYLPLEIQELIWQFVPLHYLWNFQFVSHEWREYFRTKTNANSPANNLFPRGRITWSVAISYYPTEYHFLSAKRFFDLSKKSQKDISQIMKDMNLENELQKKDGSDSSTKINAIKKLLMDEDGSNDYKEKIYVVEEQYGAQYYYIQKSHYFGIAIEHFTMRKLSKEESNEARRMMFMRYLQTVDNELHQQIAQDRPVVPQQPKIRERFK